jgi:hypothetical protein
VYGAVHCLQTAKLGHTSSASQLKYWEGKLEQVERDEAEFAGAPRWSESRMFQELRREIELQRRLSGREVDPQVEKREPVPKRASLDAQPPPREGTTVPPRFAELRDALLGETPGPRQRQ